MNKKPLIFITNDDGFLAKGIKALIEVAKEIGEVLVVAPDGPRSGMSNAITSISPIRYQLVEEYENVSLYACNGTPVDCVKLGISQIADRKPDLLLSGINHGSNAAISVIYSGTMGAAMEGCLFGVPSIGFSLCDHSANAHFEYMKPLVKNLAKKVLETGLPKGTCLNVNAPKGAEIKGLKVCHQTAGQWVEEYKKSEDGIGKEVFWLTGRFDNHEPDNKKSDEWALENGYASLVPVQVDMTAYEFVNQIKDWESII